MSYNPFLRNKVILVISPQSWGKMKIAKHHYALELAKAGNIVYFLNPPDNEHWSLKKNINRIRISPLAGHDNLLLIDHELYFPYIFKFHARKIFDFLVKKHINDILKIIGRPIDIIWSFDLGNLFPIKLFPDSIYKIFHPVDEPRDQHAVEAAAGATVIFSVTQEILDTYADYRIPSFFVNHGLADEFLTNQTACYTKGLPVNVGISGNLLRKDLDRNTLIQIIEENPDLVFNFYGSYKEADANVGAGADTDTKQFIEKLQSLNQVVLHGALSTTELALQLNKMDIFLICYDIEKDQSRGTNYHKVMEYLSTGKVIVSNNITTYKDHPVLVRMPTDRSSNKLLPQLFKETANQLELFNDDVNMSRRITYATKNAYSRQLQSIEQFIAGMN